MGPLYLLYVITLLNYVKLIHIIIAICISMLRGALGASSPLFALSRFGRTSPPRKIIAIILLIIIIVIVMIIITQFALSHFGRSRMLHYTILYYNTICYDMIYDII